MSEAAGAKSRLPKFMQKGRLGGFLTVVATGQLVYVSFEAFKGSLMLPMTEALGITVKDFGTPHGLARHRHVPLRSRRLGEQPFPHP